MIYWLMMGVWIFGFELFLHTLYLRAVSVALLVASVVALIWGHHVASQVAVLVLIIGSAWVYLDKQIRSQEVSQLIENQENNDNLLKEIFNLSGCLFVVIIIRLNHFNAEYWFVWLLWFVRRRGWYSNKSWQVLRSSHNKWQRLIGSVNRPKTLHLLLRFLEFDGR